MAYIRGVDVIGQSLLSSLLGLGNAGAQAITNNRSSDLINKLFNPSPTIDPNAGSVPIGGGGSIPIPSVTPGPSPFAPQNAADMASLAKMDPTGFQSAVQGYQANQGSEFNLTPGAVRFREKPPWAGGGITPIAAAPQKESSTTNEHLTKQIDPADQPFKEGGTGKLVQYEYQATSDPTTGLTSYMHRAGYDSTKGKADPAYEKSQRVIADTKDFTPPGAGGPKPAFQKVTGPMGQITHWVDPASGRVVTPEDLGITTEAPLSSSTKTMVESAPKVKDFVAKIGPQIDKVASELGPAAGRWTEFMAGKVGADNPEYTKLRTNIGLLSTLLMRMHVGARGGEYIMKHFEDMINQGKQSPANLKAAIGQINDYADQVLQEGKSGVNTTTADPLGIR